MTILILRRGREQLTGWRSHEQAGPGDDRPAHLSVVCVRLCGRVDGLLRYGRIRDPAADGPEHRPAWPANRYIAEVSSVIGALRWPRSLSRYLPVYWPCTRLARSWTGGRYQPYIFRQRAHMVHARVACLAVRGRGQPPFPSNRCSLRPREWRCTVEATTMSTRSHHCWPSSRRHASASVGRRLWGRRQYTVRVFFRPTVLGCQRGGFLLGDAAQTR